jgi:hypothetical protein
MHFPSLCYESRCSRRAAPLQIRRIKASIKTLLLIEKEAILVSMETNVDELKKKHADLDNRLSAETQRPNPDQSIITQIKREKLKVKDTLASLENA